MRMGTKMMLYTPFKHFWAVHLHRLRRAMNQGISVQTRERLNLLKETITEIQHCCHLTGVKEGHLPWTFGT